MRTTKHDLDHEHIRCIRNSSLFDPNFYVFSNPNIEYSGVDPAVHYLFLGGFEGKDPSPRFSTNAYLKINTDVAADGINALLHYELYGRREQRTIASCEEYAQFLEISGSIVESTAPGGHRAAAQIETGRVTRGGLRRALKKRKRIRVIMYGVPNGDFMSALGPQAPVWEKMKEVEEVVAVEDSPDAAIPRSDNQELVSVIIPLTEESSKTFPRKFASLVADPESIDILADKARFGEFLSAHNVDVAYPRVYATPEEAEFPCVLKRPDIGGCKGVALADSYEQLHALLRHHSWFGHKILIQSYTKGNVEYVTHAVCLSGQIIWNCSFLYMMFGEYPMRGATKYFIERTETPGVIIHEIEKVTKILRYDGPLNIDYKMINGAPTIFEFNPRLGWSLTLGQNIDCLYDSLYAIIETALSRNISPAPAA
jgi:hypothetical protein